MLGDLVRGSPARTPQIRLCDLLVRYASHNTVPDLLRVQGANSLGCRARELAAQLRVRVAPVRSGRCMF